MTFLGTYAIDMGSAHVALFASPEQPKHVGRTSVLEAHSTWRRKALHTR